MDCVHCVLAASTCLKLSSGPQAARFRPSHLGGVQQRDKRGVLLASQVAVGWAHGLQIGYALL